MEKPMEYLYTWNLHVDVSEEETNYGNFYNAVVIVSDTPVQYTRSQARHPDRAVAYALRKFSDSLVKDSFENV